MDDANLILSDERWSANPWLAEAGADIARWRADPGLRRRGVSRREFAPRLAIKALQMVARGLPIDRPAEGSYWDALHGWVEQAFSWM